MLYLIQLMDGIYYITIKGNYSFLYDLTIVKGTSQFQKGCKSL